MVCPACGRPEPEFRHGVCLPRVKVMIFDKIEAAGDIGITTRQLLRAVYGYKVERAPAVIRNHIHQMNDMLAGTDVHITASDRRHWLLEKRKKEGTEHGTRDR